ncbi:putative pre-16S rRNA nuclease [Halolactibacillus alkaliphilus]|uniref:Putative pre-16S rRNA nuclease n=1 Tax=Halolactibacillus alkaliphilus TaxID=442899 RepID=A0A511WZD5_9BACI|nr:Holliday junction resolvase RuvX [Halolactibacillus alkaliphilus]GEN56053.1 putative pre-16S rRNA nuclease [Halolactibacillus alkaliphilus]GGN67931.1 putative pre-16S rRNA nuclease [Halolactibacillus alkaliphilus]SFO70165.1 putative holliday junction resolvase [Halolactibacillus alkaliphilus]
MKKMGLDVGSKTIGVAVSDMLGWTAQGITTIRWDEEDVASADEALAKIIKEHEISEVVVGLPKHMNNDVGDRGKKAIEYAKYIEATFNLPTVMWDERLSTMAAERILLEADVSRKKRKKVIDKMAAVMILQGYLDSK